MSAVDNLDSLLYPKSVAVIGASRSPGKVGYEVVANLINAGFTGEIVPVNPSAPEVLGVKCFPDLKSYGKKIDLGVIAVPTKAVRAAVEICAGAGAGAVVVITAGFRETGPEGEKLEREVADYCRSRGIRMMGPNCLGVINTANGLNASFAKRHPRQGNVTVISQSGALVTAILDWASARHLGLAKMVSIGNKADLNENDFLRVFARDDQTRVIMGYLENITNGDEFIKVAEEAAQQKPVVILKVGATKAGMKAASSHTGSLAGADMAYGAAFSRSGVIRADTFEALFDYCSALAMQPLPKGDRVAIITNAGGPGIMAADAAEKAGLEVVELERQTATSLRGKLPPAASVGNPIDVLGDADPERYAMALNAAQDDDTVDAIIVILTPQAMTRPAETARALLATVKGIKPVLPVFMGGEDVMPSRAELTESGLPAYTSPERAVGALVAMSRYAQWRRRAPRVVTRFPVNRRRVERIISRHVRVGETHIGEIHAKEILGAYGFSIPVGSVAVSAEHAMEVAERIGYPVAMKIASPDIIHKSDMGGVKLNLASAEMTRDAFDLMMIRIRRRMPEARIDGVYVEKMAQRGREVIIGMSRDPQFGPMLMFGLGGIFVEIMKDVTFHLAPVTAGEAMQMMRSTRSYKMLEGARGQAAVDLPSIAEGLQRISQLATDFPQVAELDINPFIVGQAGVEPVVADARMMLRPAKEGR